MFPRRLFLKASAVAFAAQGDSLPSVRHVKVYEEPGRFGGWPANHGIWSWGSEILVGFSAAWFEKRDINRHQMNSNRPEEPRVARSLDGGESWTIEAPERARPPEQGGVQLASVAEPIDFTKPGFAMSIRFADKDRGPSYFWYSYDRGRTWRGAHEFPALGTPGVAARTDYIVEGRHRAVVFLTAAKQNGREGRPFCARTTDGGRTWRFVSFIGPEPEGFSIMPSSVRSGSRGFLTAVRVKGSAANWIELWRSKDEGATWDPLGRIADTGEASGNPPQLLRLKDGRLCLTYGYRARPFSIRAKISADEGRSWTGHATLRDDAAAWDIGYPRSVQRPDGKVVTVYYYNDAPHRERFIAATIWDPALLA